MNEKTYKIGKVAQLFGVSNETLRNYEKAGLVVSQKQEDGAVRYYDTNNIRKLVGIRQMRERGFSIRELQVMYDDYTVEAYHAAMDARIQEYEQEIARIKHHMVMLEQERESVIAVEKHDDRLGVVTYPRSYYLPYRNGNVLDSGITAEELEQWTQNLYCVRHMALYPALTLEKDEQSQYENAFLIDADGAQKINMDVRVPVKALPEMRCVSCIVRREDISLPYGGQRERIQSYILQNGLTPIGMGFSVTQFGFHIHGIKNTYFQILIPIK